MTKIQVKVPGKLYIAGEYAVVESGHTAILTAVDRYITLTIEDAAKNELIIPHYDDAISWPLGGELKAEGEHFDFTALAINTATAYLKIRKIALSPIKITIETELVNDDGIKFGLGSSAAVTTAMITGIMEKFAPDTDLLTKFKMAALSHLVVQGNGSCGDIASCLYGGLIAYTTFDQEWVKMHLPIKSLAWFLANPWPKLKIEKLPNFKMPFLVGWTGNPVSTGRLVAEIQLFKEEQPEKYAKFLVQSEKAVQKFLLGMSEQNEETIFAALLENRKILRELGQNAGVDIETELLSKLADVSESYSGVGKSSGSGGGDCGIALIPNQELADKVVTKWAEVGIKPLPFQIGEIQIKNV
ncbi:phosphomevalonate kinase [Listeria fleischmannii]|uniref:phosphomevalonate kinase n=1 Tax=Listeria fleischmannii TaxID=1069827 RepID=A0A841YD55_9LIST|nr:phosphomevalonate kinase [Listeria fleischmannii]MBC1398108.1 phosphomevalonate kinase [Listeria fleischmannii]MBC1426169.1 phosphomevalonate kinase [Listeria fleischmannii]STY34446.1 mevalonate kinase [Listeria fleischmannii subsp. coloradonensis]